MGDNVTDHTGVGNTMYNKNTKEIDVNLGSSEILAVQKVAHEFTHVAQYLDRRLDFSLVGGPGLLYDKTDEYEAYERQNLFGPISVNVKEYVDEYYSYLPNGPKSFRLLSPTLKTQYLNSKIYMFHGKN